jgi:HPt (histidine-containing phosphotransfer) domain-containing protein
LREAVTEGDSDLLERSAHSLKGELAYLGIPDAREKAGVLEQMGRNRNFERAAETLAMLEADVSALVAEMGRTPEVKNEALDC